MPENVEEAVDVAHAGDAGNVVLQTVNGSGGATTDSQMQRVNSYFNDIKNIVSPGSTAAEVGINATGDSTLQVALDGANASITPSSSGQMDIKTTGSENKKIKLGYGLSGYKSVVISNSNNGFTSNTPISGGGGCYSADSPIDGDIMWLISCHVAGECAKKGPTQCEWNVAGDGYGWTVGMWSITQKGNFKRLGEEYMKDLFSADVCKQIADADCGNGSPKSNNNLKSLLMKLTNTKEGEKRRSYTRY